MTITLTEKELNTLISFIEVDEDIMNQMIQEDIERGDDPSEHCLTLLNLLKRFKEMRG